MPKKIDLDIDAIQKDLTKMTVRNVARKHNVSNDIIYRAIKQNNITDVKSNRLDKKYEHHFKSKEKALQLLKSGNRTEIAKRLGISVSTLSKRLDKLGINKKYTHNPELSRIKQKLDDRDWLKNELKTKSVQQIADELKTTTSNVHRAAKIKNLEVKNKRIVHDPDYNNRDKMKILLETNTYKDLAKIFGVSAAAVCNQCKKLGIVTPDRGLSQDIKDKLNDPIWLRAQNHTLNRSMTEIAEELNCSATSVLDAFKKYKLEVLTGNPSIPDELYRKHWLEDKILNQKYTAQEIAKELNISHTTVISYINKHDIFHNKEYKSIPRDARIKLSNKDWLEARYKEITIKEIAKELNCSSVPVSNALIKHGIETNIHRTGSAAEREIAAMFPETTIIQNSRNLIPNSNIEADLYFPDSNFVIEHDGAYWHCTKHKPKNYHQQKKLKFLENSIDMISIWDFEWVNSLKRDIILSMISNKVNQNITKIRASKCDIKEVNHIQAKNFLDENHIQGFSACSIRYGLYLDGELIATMTFAKPRFNKKYDYEMIRFCVKKYTRIYGAASKLFKRFKEDYPNSSVISYCDLRYGNGRMYEKLEFEQSHISAPNYVWSDSNGSVIYKRYETQKHKLSNILKENFDINISEKKNMENNGYIQLFDCGNLVYTYIQ